MADPTPDQRIDADRRAKWVAFRRKHGMAEDAPFVGKCPWVECYEEQLDTLNYLDRPITTIGYWGLARALFWRGVARFCARLVARICLRNMKGGPE